MELCGDVVAVLVPGIVEHDYDLSFDEIIFWSDSTTILSYLKTTFKRRSAFETNRIAFIRKFSTINQRNGLTTIVTLPISTHVEYYFFGGTWPNPCIPM